ncbi:dTDP-4-dehydrorhamnose reductase [Methanococcoides burtonii DSM 6242]|uniref:dTDP-4-dehydrorhamnose reductase n=1 Tax=Methanococcoides burtonii (strain DSM 6242 / NBRC 107633 / OCM 468 / ACE-M) TaxID=259564 RepID=Q12TY2_METBU|nr:dTDP-4-dehydrorhamnose reductase [Methanococcoides burtonii DSM 6242]
MIIGASGMLGSDLSRAFPDAVKFTHHDLDITNKQQVLKKIEEIKPYVVINAAAYTNVDGCEDEQDIAFKVNGHAPGYIAQACSDIGAILVHFSTDYVFDGSKKEYVESNITKPINVYGQSKLMGEQEIIKNTDNYRIIRTSWLFGKNGKNFVDTMLRLSKEMENVKVVNDQFGKPTHTADIARKTAEIINLNPGIYHITNEGPCTWYEFASEIINNTVPCSSEEFPTKAKRPTYSVLTNTKTTPMRHWKNALNEYLKENQS